MRPERDVSVRESLYVGRRPFACFTLTDICDVRDIHVPDMMAGLLLLLCDV
jgi:hypothetical protein